MNSPLNRLVLLGFICQALSWDDYVLPLLSVLLWLTCLGLRRADHGMGQLGDIGGMILGCTLGYALAEPFGASKHFFIGHGLTMLQASRMTRHLDRREKVFSLLVAIGQIGVACTVIMDYRFILILFAILLLLPKALMEIERDRLVIPAGVELPRIRLSMGAVTTLFIVLMLVFFGTPRGLMGGGIRAPSVGGGAGNLLDDMLDPSFGGRANSSKMLMQVDGENVGYLRMFTLTEFRDGVWQAEDRLRRGGVRAPDANVSTNLWHRSVRVKNAAYLRKTIPYDGQIVATRGNFFRGATIDENASMGVGGMWNTANNSYEYWIRPEKNPERLAGHRRRFLLLHPPISAELKRWRDLRMEGAPDSLAGARNLENWFIENFEYELGAPNLNRLNALEDFVLREKSGHCERFASAMALLLRSAGIPTRVVVGFVPGRQNWLSGWYDIRFKDAHAWTEAWFEGHGWVALDATPRAGMDTGGWGGAELIDALDVMWYANFVNFSSANQQSFVTLSASFLRSGMVRLQSYFIELMAVLLGGILLLTLWRKWNAAGGFSGKRRGSDLEYAEHCYGQMLQHLAASGLVKEAHETPLEFLANLEGLGATSRRLVSELTDLFCEIRYGQSTNKRRAQMMSCLRELKERANAET